MLVKITTCFSFLLILCFSAVAQKNKFVQPENLSIEWKFLTNNYQQEDKNAALLTIINNDKKANLPAAGWVIYFNAVRGIVQKDAGHGLELSQLNGDLYQLRPTATFKGLGPKETISLNYISDAWIFNYTEAPSGFYLVWDAMPDKGFAITKTKFPAPEDINVFKTAANDKSGNITPAVVYGQNKNITNIPANDLQKIFPTPVSYTAKPGSFLLNSSATISADNMFEKEANFLAGELEAATGTKPLLKNDNNTSIRLGYDKNQLPEGYNLSVSSSGIIITASDAAGIFYGIQSLKCLFPLEVWKGKLSQLSIPFVEVKDYPRFGYRGLHVDVARNFQPKEEILRILNWMAMYKLNVLHFHFSDDEGWRIEIPGLPELTTVGVKRGHTLDSKNNLPSTYGSGGPINPLQSGYYTRNDYIEIIKFAKARNIELIPEIETPGHGRAAIKSMKARYERLMAENKPGEASKYLLQELNDPSVYKSVQNFNDNVMCVGLPSVYTFLEKVTDELIAMHKEAGSPLKTIHMGGDEVPGGVWEKSPACQEVLQKNPEYKNAADLWRYYWKNINKLVSSRGLYVSGWEEIGMRPTMLDNNKTMMVNPEFANANFHTYVWNNVIGFGSEDLPYRMANGGYKVILCPVSNLYFDLAYQRDYYEPGYYWGGFVDVDKPFYFIPYDYYKNTKVDRNGNPVEPGWFIGKDRLTDYGKQNIVGIQGHLWSENIISSSLLEYQALPKMLGLAERAWAADPIWATTNDKKKSDSLYSIAWSEFVNTLGKKELTKLAWYQGGANFRIPTVGAIIENGAVVANIQLPGLQIRYTTDGTAPENKSTIYSGPIPQKGTIILRAFDDKGRGGRSVLIENR